MFFDNASLAWRVPFAAVTVATVMFAFGYAMIPLYYKFCAAFGIETARDTTLAATVAPPPPRALRVEFDANSHNDMVSMRPAQRIATMNTGTAYSITYEIQNLTDRPLVGLATPSYAPARTAKWMNKLQCFCFDELSLAPGELLRAPVVFLLERDLPQDIEAMSLSYTFHPRDDPKAQEHSH